jgi:peptidyl-prolyl cis-trans isomerase C
MKAPAMGMSPAAAPMASVNGVPLHAAGEQLPADELRRRASTELLRQAAQAAGLLDAGDVASADGVASEAAAAAIEALLERELRLPEPSEEACRRHYAARQADFRTGERARVRHILFAVTPGVDVAALRKRAEPIFLDARCRSDRGATGADAFAEAARKWSNCPSGAQGGDLGWLSRDDCAPEIARELFGHAEVGVLPRLVHSRFGLHVIEVLERDPGTVPAFDAVRGAAAMALRQQAFVTALRQYLRLLAGAGEVQGVDLEAAETPLVQ